MIVRFRLGQGTNVSETDRVMSNRHMAGAILAEFLRLSPYSFIERCFGNCALRGYLFFLGDFMFFGIPYRQLY